MAANVLLLSMIRILYLLITSVLFGSLSISVAAQNNTESSYPFSWAGVSTYSLEVNSFRGAGESENSTGNKGTFHYLQNQIEKNYFSNLGVEALVISLKMDEPSQDCVLFGNTIHPSIGDSESFSSMTRAAHVIDHRVVLSLDAARWCGEDDLITLAIWVDDYSLDGIRFESADRLSEDNAMQIRLRLPRVDSGSAQAGASVLAELTAVSVDRKPEINFWFAGVFPDEASSRTLADSGFLDAVTISAWDVAVSADDSLSTVYQRAVTFMVNHPATSLQTQIVQPLSGHADNARLREAVTRLLLQPGAIDLFSGADKGESEVNEHWRKLGSFRNRHPAIGAGVHEDLSESPYMFYRGLRVGSEVDEVVVVTGATGQVRLHVSLVFDDDTVLRDAYTGKVVLVSYGQVRLEAHESGVILLEEIQ